MTAYPQWWDTTKTFQITAETPATVPYGTTRTEALVWMFNDKGSLLSATAMTPYYIVAEASRDGGETWERSGPQILNERWIEISVTGNVDNTGGAISAQSTAYTPIGTGYGQLLTSIPQGCAREIAVRVVVPLGASEAGVKWRLVVDTVKPASALTINNVAVGSAAVAVGSFEIPFQVNGSAVGGTYTRLHNSDATNQSGGHWMPNNTVTAGWFVGKNDAGSLRIAYSGTQANESAALAAAKDTATTTAINIDTSGRVGIGGTDASVRLVATSGAAATYIKSFASNASEAGFFAQNSARYWFFGAATTTGAWQLQNQGVIVYSVDTSNNHGFGGTPSAGGGQGVLFIANRTAAPSSNPTAGHIIYSESGALKGRGSSGTVTTIAAAEPHCPVCKRDVAVIESVNGDEEYFFVCIPCMIDDLGLDSKPYVVRAEAATKGEKREGGDVTQAHDTAKERARQLLEDAKVKEQDLEQEGKVRG